MAKFLPGILCAGLAASVTFYNTEIVPGFHLATSTIENSYNRVVKSGQLIASNNPALDDFQRQQEEEARKALERAKQIVPDFNRQQCIENYDSAVAKVKAFAEGTGRKYYPKDNAASACSSLQQG